MKNIIGKETTKKVYFYFSLGYFYFSTVYSFCKKIYMVSLNNELKNKIIVPVYVIL